MTSTLKSCLDEIHVEFFFDGHLFAYSAFQLQFYHLHTFIFFYFETCSTVVDDITS